MELTGKLSLLTEEAFSDAEEGEGSGGHSEGIGLRQRPHWLRQDSSVLQMNRMWSEIRFSHKQQGKMLSKPTTRLLNFQS